MTEPAFRTPVGPMPSDKPCSYCGVTKPLEDFHRQATQKDGRQSFCKPCATIRQRKYRGVKAHPEVAKVLPEAPCEICGETLRLHLDHDHTTGNFRGWLCQVCNVVLGAVEKRLRGCPDFLDKVTSYLNKQEVPE